MLGKLHDFGVISRLFQNYFEKNSFRTTIRVSNGLDPDQDRRSVGPDRTSVLILVQTVFKVSADKKVSTSKERVNY